jgi:hypothetical protein
MDGEFASVSCDFESMTCGTQTATGTTKETLGQRLSRAWVRTWKSPAQMWLNFMEGMERMLRVCDTMPVACNHPL